MKIDAELGDVRFQIDKALGDLVYQLMLSSNLTNWEPIETTVETETPSLETRLGSIAAPSEDALFFRLEIQR